MLLSAIFILCVGTVLCECPVGWKSYGLSCYLFSTAAKVTWFEAASSCLSHHADIVSVKSSDEQEFLQNITQVSGGEYWLGGRDDAVKGTWEWAADNTILEYTNWGPGQPDNGDNEEDCMEMKRSDNWKWNDKECDAHLHFICKMEKPGLGSGIIGK